MKTMLRTIALAGFFLFASAAAAGGDKLLEFRVDGKTYQGKVEALGKRDCWLLERDGRMHQLRLSKVKSFRRVKSRFTPYRAAEMRDQLRREFGKEYEVAGAGPFLVCAPRGRAKQYAALFDDVYRTFRVNFGSRGFRLSRPEFPLVAVVLPDRKKFAAYQRGDGIRGGGGLLGYYLPTSNRVALFEPAAARLSLKRAENRGPRVESLLQHSAWEPLLRQDSGLSSFARVSTVSGSLEDTIIHEAIHQVAFNTGLHSRIGENPRWVVEGLATVFESDGIRNRSSSRRTSAFSRINRGRFIAFQNYAQKRRKEKSLESFIASDRFYRRAPRDFYSQSWALSFYLIETRSRQFAGYLKEIAARDPLKPYTSKQRVSDFKAAFGDDLVWLETGFLRYLDGLR